MQYKVCEKCGAHLDFGERCDCETEEKRRSEKFLNYMKASPKTGQFSFQWDNQGGNHAG